MNTPVFNRDSQPLESTSDTREFTPIQDTFSPSQSPLPEKKSLLIDEEINEETPSYASGTLKTEFPNDPSSPFYVPNHQPMSTDEGETPSGFTMEPSENTFKLEESDPIPKFEEVPQATFKITKNTPNFTLSGGDSPPISQNLAPTVVATPIIVQPTEDSPSDNNMRPGAYLRHAREQKRLSIQHVADRLYLDTGVIQALENDDYDKLPSAIFVRGYLRNYAKLLDIPKDSIIEAYELLTGQHTLPSITPQNKPKAQASGSDSWVRMMTYAIIITAIVFLTLWYYTTRTTLSLNPNEDPNFDHETTKPLALLPLPETDDDPLLQGENTDYPASLIGLPTNTPPPAIDLPTTPNLTGNTPEVTPGNTAATPPNPSGTPTVPNATDTSPAATPTQGDTRNVKINLKNRTWLKVTDNTGKTLYNGISQGSETLNLSGEPPFKINSGHTEGISVDYLGKTLEMKDLANRKGNNAPIDPAQFTQL